jgi:hypothetical protein
MRAAQVLRPILVSNPASMVNGVTIEQITA